MRMQKNTKSSPIVARMVKVMIGVFSMLPIRSMRHTGIVIGSLLWRLPNRLRDISVRNVNRCFPELTKEARIVVVRQSLTSTGRNAAEAGAMWRWSKEKLDRLAAGTENEDIFRRGVDRGKGVLLLAPHLGNWEFAASYISARYQAMALYRPPRIAELDLLIRESRERFGGSVVPASGAGLRTFARAIAAGQTVALLPDQEPLKQHGVFAPFFGTAALTMVLVRHLVRRYDPTVVFLFAERQVDGRFCLRFRQAPEGLGDRDPIRAATQLNLGVEECVRMCPSQYMWSYRRFRTRPPGEGKPQSGPF